jgi:hypothetical protein
LCFVWECQPISAKKFGPQKALQNGNNKFPSENKKGPSRTSKNVIYFLIEKCPSLTAAPLVAFFNEF